MALAELLRFDRDVVLAELDRLVSTDDDFTLTQDDFDWWGKVSLALLGPDPHPPQIEKEFSDITDILEDQAVAAGELLRELISSPDLPDTLKQLHVYFAGLPEVESVDRERLLLHPSARKAGEDLSRLLARIGLTPLAFIRALTTLGDAFIRVLLLTGPPTPGREVTIIPPDARSRKDSLGHHQCGAEIASAIGRNGELAHRLTEWLLQAITYRPYIIPDWQVVSGTNENEIRLRLLDSWNNSHVNPIDIRKRWRQVRPIREGAVTVPPTGRL